MTRTESAVDLSLTPTSFSLPRIAPGGGIATGDVEIAAGDAPAMRNVPASMRSGMMRCFAPFSLLDAFDADGGRAGAFDLAPILFSKGEVGDFGFAGGSSAGWFRLRREWRP
jgi:hypothetical protein